MPTITLSLPHTEYDILIEPGCLPRLGQELRARVPHDRAAVFLDEGIEADLGRPAAKSLQEAGYDTAVAVMPVSEQKKTLGTVRNLYEILLEHKLERGSPVVAVGGGITGDVTGFVAATYLRGVPFVQVPTTLLSMVDASVGGKTGVNTTQGKNLIGAFHQPSLVLIDPLVLESLPPRVLACGLAECVKHGIIRDAELFEWIEENANPILAKEPGVLTELIARNVAIKAAVVEADEKEAGLRAHLNLGHTFAHAIEATNRFSNAGYMHGEAVSIGLVAACRLAAAQSLCPAELPGRVTALLGRLGLPTDQPNLAGVPFLMKAMGHDKKVQDGRIRLVLPIRLGEAIVTDRFPAEVIEKTWRDLGA